MKDKIIQSFTIKGLFGLYDVHIPFEHDVMILIGENGMGKTQIMNLLYYVLHDKLDKINIENVDELRIGFKDDELVLTKPEHQLVVSDTGIGSRIRDKYHDMLSRQIGKREIYYLPTYRRIEEKAINIIGLGRNYREYLKIGDLVNFGEMDDIENNLLETIQRMLPLSKRGLAEMSGEISDEIYNGDLIKKESEVLDKINQEEIEIILERVGDNINKSIKNKIRHIVATKEVEEKDSFLLYDIRGLINRYNTQREQNDLIKQFRDICNKYLVNKTLVYDESKRDIYVKINQNNERIDLNDLSFGEKQIISVFTKIYLSPPDSEFIVLIDEPELSLSIFWQREFLPDIYNSGKVRFLLAVTHSPFIFENELDKYAVSLNEYMKPTASTQVEQPV